MELSAKPTFPPDHKRRFEDRPTTSGFAETGHVASFGSAKLGYQPAGPGTITRISVLEVDVRWDGGTVTRSRRVHLHNFRHVAVASETVEDRREAA